MKTIALLINFILPLVSYANTIIDVYGTDKKTSDKILKKYSKKISKIEEELIKLSASNSTSSEIFEKKVKLRSEIIQQIKQEHNFLFVDISNIFNTQYKDRYITVDVVEKNEPERLALLPKDKDFKPTQTYHDLIHEMQLCEEKFLLLVINHQITEVKTCPIYHCFADFTHPELKPYLDVFNTGAVQQRQLILNTLNNDPNPERRSSAAFLIGHFKNPEEIVTILSKHINDPNSKVRNNALRVIGETIHKAKLNNIDATPFARLLDSPNITDRNKTLIILLSASKSNRNRQIILQHSKALLAMLKLHQPINHDLSYQLLTQLSGKNFAEFDIQAWEKWFQKNHYMIQK